MNENKKFEEVLDECLDRMLVRGETLEQCLQRFPEHSDKLRPLLETVTTARRVMPVQPRPEFKERARSQFNSALRAKSEKKIRAFPVWSWPRSVGVAVAILLVLSLTATGTVAAAHGSMPDSPLYPVKLATEQVQMALTFSDLGKAELHAKLADERVTEITYLAANHPEKIADASENLKGHLAKMSVLVRAPEEAGRLSTAPGLATPRLAPSPAAPVTPGTQEESPAVNPTAVTAPPPKVATASRPEKDEGATKKAASANESKKASEKAGPKSDERAKLKSKVEGQASNNAARLRSLLETAPESAKPSLQRAIDDSESEYERAIKALDD